MAVTEKTTTKAATPRPAAKTGPGDDEIADALDPTTGDGVQDVVQVPSVLKDGRPDQTPGHVVLDPKAAAAADEARTAAPAPDATV